MSEKRPSTKKWDYPNIISFVREEWGTWRVEKKYQAGYPNLFHNIFLGDFNGDRKTDLLTHLKNDDNLWQIAFSRGNAFDVTTLAFPFAPNIQNDHVLLSDFDGDGKTDIMLRKRNASAPNYFHQYLSRGLNKWQGKTYNTPNYMGVYSTIGDFDGDGKADIICHDVNFEMFTFRNDSRDKLLMTTRNGLGMQTNFRYRKFTDPDPNFYSFTGNTDYPFNTLKLSSYAVSYSSTDYIFEKNRKNYSYKNLHFHKGGRGMLGFEQTSIADVEANTLTTNRALNWTLPFYIPQTTENTVTSTANGGSIPISKTTRYYVTTATSGFRFKHQLDWMLTNDLLQGTYLSKRYWYDTWGNVRQAGSETNGWFEETVQKITYNPANFTLTPVPSLPSSIETTLKRNDIFGTPVTTTTAYRYNNGKLTQQREFDNLPGTIITNYSPTPVGLPQSSTTTVNGMSRSSSKTYDPLYRFPISTTDAVGQTTTTTYDYRWGVPLTQTSIDYQTTTFGYDPFGRLQSTTVPEGYSITQNYTWEPSGIVRYWDIVTHPGHGTTKKGYDNKGREREVSKSLWGSGTNTLWSTSTKYYNAVGQLLHETAPRFPSEPTVNTTYAYDNLNRISRVITPIGTTTYSYIYGTGTGGGTLKVEVTDPAGHKTSKETDAAGRVLKSTTEGGIVRYDYDAWGNAKRTTVGMGNAYSSISYFDDYNRLSKVSEPSAGNTSYTYNGFGERTAETDAAGKVTTTDYDALGRVAQRIGAEGTTTYEYWPIGYGGMTGRLKTIYNFNGQQADYFYNSFGRNNYVGESINGQLYETSYDYDGYGRLSTTNYPNNGPLISNLYNDHGLLTTVINGTSTIYTSQDVLYNVESINGRGKTITSTRANGLVTTNAYHQHGPLVNTYTQKTGGNKVQDYSLTYDWLKGLISTRQDNALNTYITEAFDYDAAGRLTSSTLNNPFAPVPPPQDIMYGTNGSADNITKKSDIGQFQYNGKIHALSYAYNSMSQIPVQTQEVRYTPFHRPDTLMEDDWMLIFQYGPDYERRYTELYHNGGLEEKRWYFGSGSERHEDLTTGNNRDLFYIPGPDGVAAIIKRDGEGEQILYPYADHLGTITALTDANGDVICRQAFDPWGWRRNPVNWTIDDNALPAGYSWLRGFTGHEHLPQFRLINMNARLYDPMLGRMLSPDNYVTNLSDPKAYNLYSYANNNPISNIDPSGNFIWSLITAVVDFWTQGFSGGFDVTKGWNRMSESWAKFDPTARGSKTHNAIDIDLGMFQSDENRTFFGRIWQVAERFTTAGIITNFGRITGHVENLRGRVKDVHYFHGATVMEVPDLDPLGQARGSYIRIRQYDGLEFNSGTNNLTNWSSVLVHEYGHYLQSSRFGFLSNVIGAINSGLHPNANENDPKAWFEMDASARGVKYFERTGYKIDGYGFSYPSKRINYNRQLNRLGGLEFLGALDNPFVIFLGNNP